MIRPGASPIGQQIALDLIAPPLLTALWWLLSRGWSELLGTTGSQAVKGWQHSGTWIVLVVCYVLMFGMTIYGYLF